MRIAVTAISAVATRRFAQRMRAEVLSSPSIERFERELVDELDRVSFSDRTGDADARRDLLERAVRRVWGATL